MSAIRYLLDEHVDQAIRRQLLKRDPGLVVWRIGDFGAPDYGTLDPDILLWCERHNFILVTNNRASIPVHLREHLDAGHHIPGIIEMNENMGIGEIIETLLLIWGASEAEEYHDTMVYLPLR